MNQLLGLAGFALVGSITPGPNNSLLLASGSRFGFRRTGRHVAGTALGAMPAAENVFDQIGAPCTRTFRPFNSAMFFTGLLTKILRVPPPA